MTPVHVLDEENPVQRAIGLALFLLPIGYLAEILSVAIHEVLGHGLWAVVLGGTFSGFVLKWDAMGWALCDLPSDAPPAHQVLHLAAGVGAEILCGVAFLTLCLRFRKRRDIQLALLTTSGVCLTAGSSYILWNAVHPVPPGDIGRIFWLCVAAWPSTASAVRWTFLVFGAVLLAGTTFCFYKAMFVRIEALVLHGGRMAGGQRLVMLLVFLVLPDTISWLAFDWDQLAPGIGWLPRIVGVLSTVAVGGLLFWYRPGLEERGSDSPVSWRHIAVSWACLIGTVLALVFWLGGGVYWGSDR